MQSLRRTLSVRFTFTMFTALFVIALWAFIGTNRILRSELDDGLAAAAHIASSVIAAGHSIPTQRSHADPVIFRQEINRFVIVRAPDGTVLGVNTPYALDLPYDSAALADAGRSHSASTTQMWRGEQFRSMYLSVGHDVPGDPRIVQVAASLAPIEAAGRQVFLLMLGTVALGTVAAALGAGWLSRSTTAPVAEITAQAEEVAPGAVGQRITAHAQVEEFNRLVTILNRMLERLDQGLLAQRRIIADVGHDLRTPITAMLGEVEVTLRHPRSPERYQEVLRSILEEVNHLGTISDTLLLLARIEAGELAPRRMDVDVVDLARQAAQRIGQRITDHPVTFDPAAGPAEATVYADRGMLELVINHLLDNAVQHTPAGTAVTVSVAADADGAAVTVADRGPGVPDDMRPHLFERFYRGDSARERGGAGLGLTVAAAIVGAHHGTISAEPAAPNGLRVTVRIPSHDPAAS